MQLKNFYIECKIDGCERRFTKGPKAEDGGFSLIIYQRSEGRRIKALEVVGRVLTDVVLELDILTHGSTLPVTCNEERIVTTR